MFPIFIGIRKISNHSTWWPSFSAMAFNLLGAAAQILRISSTESFFHSCLNFLTIKVISKWKWFNLDYSDHFYLHYGPFDSILDHLHYCHFTTLKVVLMYFRPHLPRPCGLKRFVFMQNKEKLCKIAKKRRENTKYVILLCRGAIIFLSPCILTRLRYIVHVHISM